jgi:ribosomal RNA-processing protein 8
VNAKSTADSAAANGEAAAKPSKKRKRSGKPGGGLTVTSENVAELWDKYVEGSSEKKVIEGTSTEAHSKGKKRKTEKQDGHETKNNGGVKSGVTSIENGDGENELPVKRKTLKEKKREKRAREAAEPGAVNVKDTKETASPKPQSGNIIAKVPPPSEPAQTTQPQSEPKLTPLQSSMRQKLISSRFRYLNETLYTTPSSSSLELFKQNPLFFSEYHEGFRRQVSSWPANPVDGFVRWIKERGAAGPRRGFASQKAEFRKGKNKKKDRNKSAVAEGDDASATPSNAEPLPRNPSSGLCTIVDLGCGDAPLARALVPTTTKHLNLRIHSYDLAAPNEHITIADISSLPLQNSSVDVAIFCLALMGTNWIDFVEEAWRVLRWKGECWIGEVGSRFAGTGKGKGAVVEHSVGNRVKPGTETASNRRQKAMAKGKKKGDELDDMPRPEDIGAAEEEVESQTKTDVSAFVEVLRRRGFVLAEEPELGNKMFVRMKFIKAASPVVGKNAATTAGAGGTNGSQGPGFGRKKFVEREGKDGEVEISAEEEAKVLKPCVYKTR